MLAEALHVGSAQFVTRSSLATSATYPSLDRRLSGISSPDCGPPTARTTWSTTARQGKRAYYIASKIPRRSDDPPGNEVLERLSHEYDVCVQGLTEIRRESERRDPGGNVASAVAELAPALSAPQSIRIEAHQSSRIETAPSA